LAGQGLLLGIELVEDKQTKEPAGIEKMNKVISACKEKGLIIGKNGDTVAGYNNILQLSPPLSITEDDFTFIVKTLKESIYQL
jgi:4-aminobutyrate aminotransferase-like enzyme